MSDETGPAMDDEFAARMRRGLAAMAPREVARARRIRRRAAGASAGALALVVVAVLGVQVAGAGGQGGVEAVPTPSSSIAPSAEPSPTPSATPAPSATPEPEPTPPPGFEGVAAGVPVVVDTLDTAVSGGFGDTGGAGGDEGYAVHDVYVLCRGSGVVTGRDEHQSVDCSQEAPSTVVAMLGVVTFASEGSQPTAILSPDFTGTVRIVPAGATPGGIGIGGVASVWVTCPASLTIGGVPFTCGWQRGTLIAAEEAAWGIPYGPDALVPAIEAVDGGRVPGVIRFVLDPSS